MGQYSVKLNSDTVELIDPCKILLKKYKKDWRGKYISNNHIIHQALRFYLEHTC